MHLHVCVSVLHMNVKHTTLVSMNYVYYLPEQWCSPSNTWVFSVSIDFSLFFYSRKKQVLKRFRVFCANRKLDFYQEIYTFISSVWWSWSHFCPCSPPPLCQAHQHLSAFICLPARPPCLCVCLISDSSHYIDLQSHIRSDIFKETASGEGVAHHRRGWMLMARLQRLSCHPSDRAADMWSSFCFSQSGCSVFWRNGPTFNLNSFPANARKSQTTEWMDQETSIKEALCLVSGIKMIKESRQENPLQTLWKCTLTSQCISKLCWAAVEKRINNKFS